MCTCLELTKTSTLTEMGKHLADLENQLANMRDHEHLRGWNRLVHIRQSTQSEAHGLATPILCLRNQVMTRSTVKRIPSSY